MNTLIEPQSITLYYREGSSDKVYQCSIEPAGELFLVNFAYGRRGATLSTGTKTTSPVDFDTARQIYDKLVREKTAKGYTPGPDGTPYQNSPKAERFTGVLPQLLNPIDEAEVQRLLRDTNWCLQEKFDGRRILVQKTGDVITGINRKGLTVSLPSPIVFQLQKLPTDFLLDGECVGDVFYAFDLLQLREESQLAEPYGDRLHLLTSMLESMPLSHIELVDTVVSPAQKAILFKTIKAGNKEGVVFKRLDAPYTPGRPNSGGSQLKHKFTATLSAVVARINAQRSVELRLIGQDGWVTAGNVTIPPNHPIPQVGDVVDTRYLYAFRESGVLYQPVYLGQRSDIDPAECMTAQLKFKAAEDVES